MQPKTINLNTLTLQLFCNRTINIIFHLPVILMVTENCRNIITVAARKFLMIRHFFSSVKLCIQPEKKRIKYFIYL